MKNGPSTEWAIREAISALESLIQGEEYSTENDAARSAAASELRALLATMPDPKDYHTLRFVGAEACFCENGLIIDCPRHGLVGGPDDGL